MVTTDLILKFYAGKKILVTGHTGFKGGWLIATLYYLGAEVIGYALDPEYPDGIYNYVKKTKWGISIINDIRNKQKIEEVITSYSPDIIFHLAAQPLVRVSYEKPAETFEINVAGTANLLESVIKLEHKCSIIVVTTDKVYFNKEEDILYREDDKLGGYDPYSASKACTELVVESFKKSFFNPCDYENHKKAIASVRAGNVIGGGDWSKDRLMPDIINSLKSGKSVLIRNPDAIRPWQYIMEAISGYLILAMNLHSNAKRYSTAYNLGPMPNDHYSVKDLVKTAISIWGSGDWHDVSNNSNPHEAGVLKLSIEKALKELNWKPKLNAAEAIKWTVEWYKTAEAKKADYTYNQIKEYFTL